MIDAHTHLQKIPKSIFPTLLSRAQDAGLSGAVVCGTCPDDWEGVKEICASKNSITFYAGYGVHPWYVKNLNSDTWVDKLRGYLKADVNAHVGEIGLDKHFPDLADLETQKAAMKTQLEIAKEFSRPVTIHNVKAQAEILEILRVTGFVKTGLPVILHSFSGNLEQLDQLVKFSDQFYFSVNCKFNRENVMRKIPENRLLLETDSPDQLANDHVIEPLLVEESSKKKPINDPAQIKHLIARVAKVRGVTEEALIAAVLENTKSAFRIEKTH